MADYWYFIHTDPQASSTLQYGPVPLETLAQAVRAGQLDSTCSVWQPGMASWKAVAQIADAIGSVPSTADAQPVNLAELPSSNVAPASAAGQAGNSNSTAHDQWLYLDASGAQCGPIGSAAFSALRAAGTVTPDTYVWQSGMPEWLPLAAVPALQDPVKPDSQAGKKRPRKARENTWIYLAGLPGDVTRDELVEFTAPCGILRQDDLISQPRMLIYRTGDRASACRGDAVVCFLKPESVVIALQILDGAHFRPGVVVSASEPEWNDEVVRPRVGEGEGGEDGRAAHLSKADLNVMATGLQQQNAELAWLESADGAVSGVIGRKVVVLSGMFVPGQLRSQQDVAALEAEVVAEIERTCGPVHRCTVFAGHPDGIVQVRMRTVVGTQALLAKMKGQVKDGRPISAKLADGSEDFRKTIAPGCEHLPAVVTTHQIKESAATESARLDAFGDWLESGAATADKL